MARIGYAQVSSFDQDHATQTARLEAAGCEIIRKEKASGKTRAGRDELAAILDFIRPGDEPVVVKLGSVGPFDPRRPQPRSRAWTEGRRLTWP